MNKVDLSFSLYQFKMCRTFCISSLSLLVLQLSSVYCALSTVRQTLNGPIEGVEQISLLGQKYYAFKGVPFAEAPITGTDPYTGAQVDRRFKVCLFVKFQKVYKFENNFVQ